MINFIIFYDLALKVIILFLKFIFQIIKINLKLYIKILIII